MTVQSILPPTMTSLKDETQIAPKLDKYKRLQGVDYLTSAACNLDCDYCYIPKEKSLNKRNREIVSEKVQNKKYIQELRELYGENLRHFSMWGGEPTTTLKHFTPTVRNLLEAFPHLSMISFSTNMTNDPKIISDFAYALDEVVGEFGRQDFKFEAQVSIDGPKRITDVNRGEGVTERIFNNMVELVGLLQNIKNLKEISFPSKTTWNAANLRMLNDDLDTNVLEFLEFFKNIDKKINGINKNPRISVDFLPAFSLAVPGNYTVEDGRIFSNIIKFILDWEKANGVPLRQTCCMYMKRIIGALGSIYQDDFHHCSAGQGAVGVGASQELHMCHRTLLINYEDYANKQYDQPTLKLIKRYIADSGSELETSRLSYILTSYIEFDQINISSIMARMQEMVACGQVDQRYADEDMRRLFATVIPQIAGCQFDNLLMSKNMHVFPARLIRQYANDAFGVMWDRYQEHRRKLMEVNKNASYT